MKNKYTAIVAAILCASGTMTLKASSGFDLILGFTQLGGNSSGNDYLLDIGPSIGFGYPGGSPIASGQTWNVNAALAGQGINLAKMQWGVVGDALVSDG